MEADVGSGLETLGGILFKTMSDDPRHAGLDPCAVLRQFPWLLLQDGTQRFNRRAPLERLFPRHHLVDDRPEGEDVGSMIGRQPPDLFGRHVADGSEDHAWFRSQRRLLGGGAAVQSRWPQLRQPEVENLDAPVRRDEHVLRLQIAMNDALRVRGRESSRQLRREVQGLPDRERRPANPFAQVLTLEQLRDDVRRSLVESEVVDGEDPRMVQCRGRLCFEFETTQTLVVGGE